MWKYSILKISFTKLFISSNLWTLVFQLGSTTRLTGGMTALGWKVLRHGGVPELHQENCWDQPLPAVTWQILHRTLPFPTLSFILTFAEVSRSFPFPVIAPGCPASLLKDLHFFAVTDTGFEEQFRVLLSFLSAGEAGRTSQHLYASLFPKSTM